MSDSLGGAVARKMAMSGAKLFVTNRRPELAEEVARDIRSAGGYAVSAAVDVLNGSSVQTHIDQVVAKHGRVDVSFNLAGFEVLQNVPLIEMTLEEFVRPITTAMQMQFLTASAAGRIMRKQKSGVILTLTATPGGIGYPGVGGFGPICSGIETFSKNLAAELGPCGVRVVNIRSAGSLDSRSFKTAIDSNDPDIEGIIQKMRSDTMLKDMPRMEDIASLAAFLASDMASRITGTTIDITTGTTTALNYKTG